MKNIISSIVVLFSALHVATASADSYECKTRGNIEEDFRKVSLIVNNDATISILGRRAKANRLRIASMGSSTSQRTLFEGSYLPAGRNVLSYIGVWVDNELLHAQDRGKLLILSTTQDLGTAYFCRLFQRR